MCGLGVIEIHHRNPIYMFQVEMPYILYLALLRIETLFFDICNSAKELQTEMLLFLAVKCYQRSLLSIGKAAELAGMSKVNFENCIEGIMLAVKEFFSEIEMSSYFSSSDLKRW